VGALSGFTVPREVGPILALLESVRNELAVSGGGPVCDACFYPGSAASYDFCGPGMCSCDDGSDGMLYIVVEGVYPYTVFGGGMDARISQCAASLAARVRVGVVRCVPVGDESDPFPSCDELMDASLRQMADMRAMRTALTCTQGVNVLLRQYDSDVASGGCVGGSWLLDVDLEY
jgi:hypothetical protein